MIIPAGSFTGDGSNTEHRVVEAEPKAKVKSSLSRCVRYGQTMGSDKQSVDIKLRNRCRVPVSCSLERKVSCDADEAGTDPREFADVMKLSKGARDSINASAAACGDDGWAITDITWECEPL